MDNFVHTKENSWLSMGVMTDREFMLAEYYKEAFTCTDTETPYTDLEKKDSASKHKMSLIKEQ